MRLTGLKASLEDNKRDLKELVEEAEITSDLKASLKRYIQYHGDAKGKSFFESICEVLQALEVNIRFQRKLIKLIEAIIEFKSNE